MNVKNQDNYTKMSISERLKTVMSVKSLNIKGFSEATSIPYRSVQNYLLENRDPNVDALVKINQTLNVNITWLLTGNGEIFCSNVPNQNLSIQEIELLNHYRSMNEIIKNNFSSLFKEISFK